MIRFPLYSEAQSSGNVVLSIMLYVGKNAIHFFICLGPFSCLVRFSVDGLLEGDVELVFIPLVLFSWVLICVLFDGWRKLSGQN